MKAEHFSLMVFLVFCTLAGAAGAEPGSWPQWGGADRDFKADAGKLATSWPENGPKELWSRELGEDGYAAIVAGEGRLYTLYRQGDNEVAIAIDPTNGKTIWETPQEVPLDAEKMRLDYGTGPMSTPAISDSKLFTIGALQDVRAHDLDTGKVVWSRDLMDEMGAPLMPRGYGASPLAWNGLLILTPGCSAAEEGEEKASGAVIALSQADGKLVWKSEECFPSGYSSPILAEVEGEPQVMVALGTHRAGFDAKTGTLRWHMELDNDARTTMSTQIWDAENQILFGSSAYADGTRGLHITKQSDGSFSAEELWYTRKMRVQHATAVHVGDRVYGSSGDFGPAFLAAVDIKTGELAFRQRGFSKTNLLAAGDHLILLDEDGNLAIGTPTADGIEIHSKAKVLERLAWTVPTLLGTRLYVRDRHHMKAFDLGS